MRFLTSFLLLLLSFSTSHMAMASVSNMIEPCIMASSAKYPIVHPDLIRAIIKTESGGRNGIVSKNSNKSKDLGVMQINTIHLPELQRYGITRDQLINDPCTSIATGTWMLAKHLSKAKPGDQGFWNAVANYHSKTPKYNSIYQRKVWQNLQAIRRGQR